MIDVDMDPEDIKHEIRKRGRTMSGIAARLGISRQALRQALTVPSARSEKAIARAIGKSPALIWPSRYESSGRRKKPQPAINYRNPYRFSKRGTAS
jgi:Ner family transcriptional regulator